VLRLSLFTRRVFHKQVALVMNFYDKKVICGCYEGRIKG